MHERRVDQLTTACLIGAVLAGPVLGAWEWSHPVFSGQRYTLTPSGPAQLWGYGIIQAISAAGFVAGLFALVLVATSRGIFPKIMLGLSALGAITYAVVWLAIAARGRDDAIYLGGKAIGSDIHGNGGFLFLWIAPLVLGITGLVARRAPWWLSAWAIVVAVVGSRLFGILPVWQAMIGEGALWGVLALLTRRASSRATELVPA
jgi:hypothetical protein